MSRLIITRGLPGAGKTTLARALARPRGAVHLRIDSIEAALNSCATLPAGVVTEGYVVAYRLAADNLCLGLSVIADSSWGAAKLKLRENNTNSHGQPFTLRVTGNDHRD